MDFSPLDSVQIFLILDNHIKLQLQFMLSICIPVYNYYVEKLIRDLHRQASELNVDFEIVLIDDFSDVKYKEKNESLTSLTKLSYIELSQNIGRSKIRNVFVEHAQFENLLFLDCDAEIISDGFLKNYNCFVNDEYDVVCGGLCYSQEKPENEFLLRWKYGQEKEVVSLEKRIKYPYKSFKTINFLIKKDVFESVKFNEQITGYGHEDTLFGYELKKSGIKIKHIDNVVLHAQLETNQQFIEKTEQSIENLIKIVKLTQHFDFENEVFLLQTYKELKKGKILFVVNGLFWIFKSAIRKLLILGYANLTLFAFYKLGFLIHKHNK